jgi:hypothetical protein
MARARRGQAEAALADFNRWDALAGERGSREERYYVALARVAARDVAGYRAARSTMAKGTSPLPDRYDDLVTAWAWTLAPTDPAELAPILAVAEKAAAEDLPWGISGGTSPPPLRYERWRPVYQHLLGALRYRAGRWAEARKHLEAAEAAKLEQAPLVARNRLFLALTCHRLGKGDEAKAHLDKAVATLDAAKDLTWDEKLELGLLRAEAEQELKAKAGRP